MTVCVHKGNRYPTKLKKMEKTGRISFFVCRHFQNQTELDVRLDDLLSCRGTLHQGGFVLHMTETLNFAILSITQKLLSVNLLHLVDQ